MNNNILSVIGNTPLVELAKLFENERQVQVFAKLEMLNPGGSAKDRPALRMIQEAWKEGAIAPGSVVIESSSGNMAISLAYICSYLDLRFISVIDPRTTEQNIRILKAYGAEIDYVAEPDQETGEFLQARLKRVQQLLTEIPNSFWPNQYGNIHNYLSHNETTMKEIATDLGRVDYVVGGVSTCGTMFGCAKYVQDHGLDTKIIVVDSEGSVIFGGDKGTRRFPGLGAGMV
ncbi:MAG: 2,3-diaminopropionate biosynthesis protein SbnA, partial [Paenibacillus sp. RIFOXYA1_FULL_44_5]